MKSSRLATTTYGDYPRRGEPSRAEPLREEEHSCDLGSDARIIHEDPV